MCQIIIRDEECILRNNQSWIKWACLRMFTFILFINEKLEASYLFINKGEQDYGKSKIYIQIFY